MMYWNVYDYIQSIYSKKCVVHKFERVEAVFDDTVSPPP